MRVADGRGGSNIKAIGQANDLLPADGAAVLDFWQAQDKVCKLYAAEEPKGEPVLSVGQALDRYEADLKTRGGDAGNVARVRIHLPATIASKAVPSVTVEEFRDWRDRLAKRLAPATVNRTCTALKAALNLAADKDERINSRRPWEIGLASLPNAERSRNVILSDDTTRAMIAEAHAMCPAFGLLVETAAITGARVSQLAGLTVGDVKDGPAPRLMIPASRKGRGVKSVSHRPVPITLELLEKLDRDRATTAPLLTKSSGAPWRKSDHSRLFARVAMSCGLDPAEVTIYALRHSSIVRQLLAGIPIRVVAVSHDTSAGQIERTYSRHIDDHADALVRRALLAVG